MYSIFCARKILLTSQKNLLNMKLLQITQKRQQIMLYAGTIADGDVTAEEISTMRGDNYLKSANYRISSYTQAAKDAGNQIDAQYNLAINQEGTYNQLYQASEKGDTDARDQLEAYRSTLYSNNFSSSLQDQAEVEQKKLNAEDYQLEVEQKRIETQISAITTELNSVEQAETKEIEGSAPKYSGISGR